MDNRLNFRAFETRDEASTVAAEEIAAAARRALTTFGEATLVLSGGSSPVDTYRRLSEAPLPWDRIQLVLTDERLVEVTDPQSNERMVRERLMTGLAAKARFTRLDETASMEGFTAACALVGMGEDGHFASLFPDLTALAELTDTDQPPAVARVHTAASPVERLTMNLSCLLGAEILMLLAFGDAKRSILDAPSGYPIDALIKQSRVPVQVIWAP